MATTDEVGMELARRQTLRRLSRAGEVIALLGAAAVGIFSLTLWFDRTGLREKFLSEVPSAVPSDGMLLVAYVLSLIPALAFVLLMVEAWGLFRALGKGRLLEPDVPRRLVRLGIIAFVTALAGFVVRTLTILVLTWEGPTRQLAISIGSNEIAGLMMGLLFLAFALVMGEAVRIEDDNRSIV